MIVDEEVLAVITALAVVASVFGIAVIVRPSTPEHFTALGLLNSNCKIGYYPTVLVNNTNVTLCIFVANYMGSPIYYKVVYKVGSNETIPTNVTPSPEEPLREWRGVLDNGQNVTFLVKVPVRAKSAGRVALIFELWIYNATEGAWTYSGRWNHLYVNVTKGW